ncbi:unnamed protein product [Leptosia nina]|uniref:Uncharacterized protein n=1 Tax=Leptosia nina TaxID=320188 RepID=A0AAV1K2I9_9NEOP
MDNYGFVIDEPTFRMEEANNVRSIKRNGRIFSVSTVIEVQEYTRVQCIQYRYLTQTAKGIKLSERVGILNGCVDETASRETFEKVFVLLVYFTEVYFILNKDYWAKTLKKRHVLYRGNYTPQG